MGRDRWGGYDEGWNYYSENRPRKVKDGIKTRSERGAIGETWWSKRWVSVLESFGMGTRLTRGRTYARQGQVISIDIEPGIVKAKVQGSMPKPYNVKIQLTPLSGQDWDNVTDVMASQALFAAMLLGGEMPRNIEDAFSAAQLSLFPTRVNDLETQCSCPDWANPCKHIAAVYYILAERFDEDPFLIFKLRGRTKEQIIEELRKKRVSAVAVEAASASAPADAADSLGEALLHPEDYLERFWQAGEGLDTFTVRPGAPEVENAILKRLGDGPFSIKGQNITAVLTKAYAAVEAAATLKLDKEI